MTKIVLARRVVAFSILAGLMAMAIHGLVGDLSAQAGPPPACPNANGRC